MRQLGAAANPVVVAAYLVTLGEAQGKVRLGPGQRVGGRPAIATGAST